MFFTKDALYIGQPDALGIWMIPVSEVEAAVGARKQSMLAQKAREKQRVEQNREILMAKYDLNHNGVLDPEEKVKAWDDPAFWALEIGNIDTNHNGLLDPEELGYFKAHGNLDLARKVGTAIRTVQQLLADQLFKKVDLNHDGVIDYNELASFAAGHGVTLNVFSNTDFWRWDVNRDRQIDPQELRLFLEELTQRAENSNRPGGIPTVPFQNNK
jgi:Ca2+-binding EF-hand superfamily protein